MLRLRCYYDNACPRYLQSLDPPRQDTIREETEEAVDSAVQERWIADILEYGACPRAKRSPAPGFEVRAKRAL